MHPLRLLGWGLLATAFFAAAMEMAAQSLTRDWGWMAAGDVLQTLAPDFYDALRESVDAWLHPLIWDHLLLPLLVLPGWLLLGVPGGALVWIFRPTEEIDDMDADSLPQASYDEIAAAAREADEDDIGIPSKYRDLEEYDPARALGEEAADSTLDPLEFEQADVVPPAAYAPSDEVQKTNGDPARADSDELSRPF